MRDPRGLARLAVLMFSSFLMLSDTPALAQQLVAPFAQIQLKVEDGDVMEVTEASGRVVRGELRKATDTEVWLDVQGEVRKYLESDVDAIRARSFDNLWEGALIGTAVGAAVGAVLVSSLDCFENECVGYAVPFAGAGAGIGIGIDAMIRRFRLVYSAPERLSRAQVVVVPITAQGARGAAVAIRFR